MYRPLMYVLSINENGENEYCINVFFVRNIHSYLPCMILINTIEISNMIIPFEIRDGEK